MATEIIKSIKQGGGGDFTSIVTWESDQDGDLVSLDEQHTGEAFNDSGAYNEVVVINGSTTDATRFMRLRAAAGEKHDGTEATGARIRSTTFGAKQISLQDDFTQLIGMELDCRGAIGSAQNCINMNNAKGILVDKCIGYGATGTAVDFVGAGTGDDKNRVQNSFFWDGAGDGCRMRNHALLHNATFNNFSSEGIIAYFTGVGIVVQNTIAMDNGGSGDFDEQGGSGNFNTFNNNMSEDGTATTHGGSGNLANKTYADQFVSVSVGSEDFHLKAGADAIDAGKDLSGFAVPDDIDGETRPQGSAYDMGGDELLVAVGGVGSLVSSIPLTSKVHGILT